jgi:uncharacterized protein YjbI with pentapeptide repeats
VPRKSSRVRRVRKNSRNKSANSIFDNEVSLDAIKKEVFNYRTLIVVLPLILAGIFLVSVQKIQRVFYLVGEFYFYMSGGSIFVALIISLLIWFVPKRQVKSLTGTPVDDKLTVFEREKERLKLEDDTRKTLAQIIGGVFLIAGLFVTYNTYRLGTDNYRLSLEQQKISIQKQDLDRRGQITERFNKSVEHLGNQDLSVRLGGLYALEQILKDSDEDRNMIIEVLSAYIREKTKREKVEQKETNQSNPAKSTTKKNLFITNDVQTALTILARRPDKEQKEDRINLAGADLTGAELEGVDLIKANLRGANLTRANLRNASLSDANLTGVDLTEVYLSGAELLDVDMTDAKLYDADLTDANLSGAIFKNADLTNAKLIDANLDGADFSGAYLLSADLSRTNFNNVILSDAKLNGATFENFGEVSNLTYAQLEQANFDYIYVGNETFNIESVLTLFRENNEE